MRNASRETRKNDAKKSGAGLGQRFFSLARSRSSGRTDRSRSTSMKSPANSATEYKVPDRFGSRVILLVR